MTLDLNSRPILYDGQFQGYSPPMEPGMAERYGLLGLRFNRMLSERVALYDIMGANVGSSESAFLGQLAVEVAAGLGPLDLKRDWDVEPKGTMLGTNAFGATLSVPLVKFWRYRDQRPSPPLSSAVDPPHPSEEGYHESGGASWSLPFFERSADGWIKPTLEREYGSSFSAGQWARSRTTCTEVGHEGHDCRLMTYSAQINGRVVSYSWIYDLSDSSSVPANDEARRLEQLR